MSVFHFKKLLVDSDVYSNFKKLQVKDGFVDDLNRVNLVNVDKDDIKAIYAWVKKNIAPVIKAFTGKEPEITASETNVLIKGVPSKKVKDSLLIASTLSSRFKAQLDKIYKFNVTDSALTLDVADSEDDRVLSLIKKYIPYSYKSPIFDSSFNYDIRIIADSDSSVKRIVDSLVKVKDAGEDEEQSEESTEETSEEQSEETSEESTEETSETTVEEQTEIDREKSEETEEKQQTLDENIEEKEVEEDGVVKKVIIEGDLVDLPEFDTIDRESYIKNIIVPAIRQFILENVSVSKLDVIYADDTIVIYPSEDYTYRQKYFDIDAISDSVLSMKSKRKVGISVDVAVRDSVRIKLRNKKF